MPKYVLLPVVFPCLALSAAHFLPVVHFPGTRISSFSQADLASGSIQYVHTSEEEKHTDAFTFSVSDGTNEVSQTFDITINPVDDSLPIVQIFGMTVQEGVRKTITEFELKATDADTEVESLTFGAVQPPRHGLMERSGCGQRPLQATTFTRDDITSTRSAAAAGTAAAARSGTASPSPSPTAPAPSSWCRREGRRSGRRRDGRGPWELTGSCLLSGQGGLRC
ncbi:extracellular matrix protein FRAS1-like isoform X1 [Cyanistes caeruleus]|uniref:extracellular matrix protein FRAS1-like isoform X1 n=1 Tax=Cyanistes caeruleus TaxID=156563 RepID=UPI000CDA6CB4|nr:extracellular matrix protein FRAS1-like isoform X1 [Cyanistes caeruleus]